MAVPVTRTILGNHMSSDRSPHTARPAPGDKQRWEVSWLPGRRLDLNEAVTAMTLADMTADGDVRPGHRLWPHIEGRAAELGMTGSQALGCTAGPPRQARRQEKTTGPPGPEPPTPVNPAVARPEPDAPDLDLPDLDPPDLDYDRDWPDPEWPDPSWPGFARRPAYMFNIAVSPWYKQHHPGKSANLRDALRAGRDPQPAPEPDKLADWEAGQ